MNRIHVDFDMGHWQECRLEELIVTDELFEEISNGGYDVTYLTQPDSDFVQGKDWDYAHSAVDLDDIAGKALLYQIDQADNFTQLPAGLQAIVENCLIFNHLKQIIDEEGLGGM